MLDPADLATIQAALTFAREMNAGSALQGMHWFDGFERRRPPVNNLTIDEVIEKVNSAEEDPLSQG